MGVLSFLLLGASLSMDALAVAVSAGIVTPDMQKRQALRMALYFGGFQALMPLLGYLLGTTVIDYIRSFDHWVAFLLLTVIGAKMIRDAFKKDENKPAADMFAHKSLLLTAVATSIDALAVGVSLALVDASIALGASVIGCATFLIVFAGAVFGKRLGMKFEQRAAVAGGAVLIAIGLKILIEHLTGA